MKFGDFEYSGKLMFTVISIYDFKMQCNDMNFINILEGSEMTPWKLFLGWKF